MTLALDDPQWAELKDAYGAAEGIPELLRSLSRAPTQKERNRLWDTLHSHLLHQGSVYTASYAATPHVIAMARALSAEDRVTACVFVGGVAGSTDAPRVPATLRAAFEASVAEAEALAIEAMPQVKGARAPWLLVAIAGARRLFAIAFVLESLSDGEVALACPSCDDELFISVAKAPFRAIMADGKGGSPSMSPDEPRRALAPLITLCRESGHAALAERVAALESTVTCRCGARWSLLDRATSLRE